MEAKTITVTRKTHRELVELKGSMKARSFDELLSRMAEEKIAMKKSMFGAAKGMRAGFSRNREDRI